MHSSSHSGVFSISSSNITHTSREMVLTDRQTRGLTVGRYRLTHLTLTLKPYDLCWAQSQPQLTGALGGNPGPCSVPWEVRHRHPAAGTVVSNPSSTDWHGKAQWYSPCNTLHQVIERPRAQQDEPKKGYLVFGCFFGFFLRRNMQLC